MNDKKRDHPVWMEISRKNIEYNWRSIQETVGEKITIIPMIKSNGYGHDSVLVGNILQDLGAKYVGVSAFREAKELRQGGVKIPLLVLDYVDSSNIVEALELDMVLAISDSEMFPAIENTAGKIGKKARVHLYVDTGMHREGIWPNEEAIMLAKEVHESPHVDLEGIMTHFATAGDDDPSFAYEQLEVFNHYLDELQSNNIPLPSYIHVANGASVMRLPKMHRDDPKKRLSAVRPGNIIYGLPPGDFPFAFTPKRAMVALKAKLACVKTIPAGSTVGYGRTWKAEKDTRIGIVPMGYTDGYRRSLSHEVGCMLVGGKKAPIIGLISMNQTVLKLPNEGDFALGDEVVIIGKQGDEEITIEEVAEKMGTFWFEYIVNINGKRIPRMLID
ncbi:MAG: alanine racemase [Candidatus Levybacteria bacterium RIFCSPHIGHO2_12_FULL_38_12]|nr:MAG: alanine racemase [Candidatus Levybacteria bacterium RIFCSPHIGHO2_01_FULL_38_12]OGH22304.1 MAG: alanine racemase [Candidatus Levybacteria bacterium RIFCSPHIGHO2_02_FULL_37_18]OGH22494.1 MAG: alanine racemase [Candidatus Levybacteria bacterium RIFCSPHIGHO2_12_FULL_38_12]OGH33761.1 MAG: alanine racemase [Candidatus Levybacteria bacterium RIFCSPLOWO2_01_FULL_37_20]OGH43461.1 MAG: alanine racemase [Candidatus Levybacteria bacterium RIFCSPLOWO2_02_FULL_37_18]